MKTVDFDAVKWGFFIALLALCMGIWLGIHFGKDEDKIDSYLKDKAKQSDVFHGNKRKIRRAYNSAWERLTRAHEHFQGIGTMAVALILLLSTTWLKPVLKTIVSIGLGVGSFCYPLFWYLAAYRTVEIGKHAAKESLAWLAQFGAGLYTVSFLALVLTVLVSLICKDKRPGFLNRLAE